MINFLFFSILPFILIYFPILLYLLLYLSLFIVNLFLLWHYSPLHREVGHTALALCDDWESCWRFFVLALQVPSK